MDFSETDAWIFLAIQQVSSSEGATVSQISLAADGINHAVPTQNEMQVALKKLDSADLIERRGSLYFLTKHGESVVSKATQSTLLKKWRELHSLLQGL